MSQLEATIQLLQETHNRGIPPESAKFQLTIRDPNLPSFAELSFGLF